MEIKKYKTQLEARGITENTILEAIKNVDREAFVPVELKNIAYEDTNIKIDDNITLPRMFVVARWLQILDIKKDDTVLLIGFDSGYLLEIIAHLAKNVYTIDTNDSYLSTIQNIFTKKAITNVHFKIGKDEDGWSEKAPFDKIFITREMKQIPKNLVEQLKLGGKAIMHVGPDWSHLYLEVIEKDTYGKIFHKNINSDYFIPKPQQIPYISQKKVSDEKLTEDVKSIYIPFSEIEKLNTKELCIL